MREYTIYFDVFGKKMKTKVIAESDSDAKKQVLDKVVFVKTEVEMSAFNTVLDTLDEIKNALTGNEQQP